MLAGIKAFLGSRVGLGVLVALAILSGLLWLQTERLDAANALAEGRAETIDTLRQRVRDDSVLLAQRDALIGKQNDAVRSIGDVNEANQEAYRARNAEADRIASKLSASASRLMQSTLATTDELERCRGAVGLIRDTIEMKE